MTPAENIEKAAILMERYGKWHGDNDPRPQHGRVCAVMAILLVHHKSSFAGDVIKAAERVLGVTERVDLLCPLAVWSDALTKKEAVAGLRSVAMILRAQEQSEQAPVVAKLETVS